MKIIGLLFLAVSVALSPVAMARGHGGSHTSASHSRSDYHHSYSYPIRRDSHGKIIRSQEAKREFKREHPCPSTGKSSCPCPGYVIDHVQALKHGGADAPSNMQWQTVEYAKAKDKWKRKPGARPGRLGGGGGGGQEYGPTGCPLTLRAVKLQTGPALVRQGECLQ